MSVKTAKTVTVVVSAVATMAELFKEYMAKMPDDFDTKKEIDEYIKIGLKEILEAKKTEEKTKKKKEVKVANTINKGTGAGGAKTNENGLKYEKKSGLSMLFTIIKEVKKEYTEISFDNENDAGVSIPFIYVKKKGFLKYLKSAINENIPIAHGCKEPDECYINENTKIIFIIETKYQQTGGSVCEKLQTAPVKKEHFRELFPTYKIEYIYCLSPWFKENCKYELILLERANIPVFWGDSLTYKKDIIDYIVNY
jgi:hypothetical protein